MRSPTKLVCSILLAALPVMAEPVTNQLTVTLADGSRLRGTTSLKELSLRSEALGKLSVQFERIASVKFSKDRESATQIMLKIHLDGKGVCGVYSKDVAATKVDQVLDAARKAGHPLQCICEPIE